MDVQARDLQPGDRLRLGGVVEAVVPSHMPRYVVLALQGDDEVHVVDATALYRIYRPAPQTAMQATHRFRFEQYHPTGEYGWEPACSCGWTSTVSYRSDQYAEARALWLDVHARKAQ